MKLKDLFRPRYLHSDFGVRSRAIDAVSDPSTLRAIYARFNDGNDPYGYSRIQVALALRDERLIADLVCTFSFESTAVAEAIAADVRDGQLLQNIGKHGRNIWHRMAVLIRLGRFDEVKQYIQGVPHGRDGDRTLLRRCFESLPPEYLDLAVLGGLAKALYSYDSFWKRIFEKYQSAGWVLAEVRDTTCSWCRGEKSILARHEDGSSWQTCSRCSGTGYLPAYITLRKGNVFWHNSAHALTSVV